MEIIDEFIKKLEDDEFFNKELVYKFFLAFSRMEYALKRADYLIGSEKEVKADWCKFGSELNDDFNKEKSEDLRSAVDYIVENPPKKQILKDNKLQWETRNDGPNTPIGTLLTRLIPTIRNNLFHGGKYPEIIEEVSRNEKLLKSALIILNEFLELKSNVKSYFEYYKTKDFSQM